MGAVTGAAAGAQEVASRSNSSRSIEKKRFFILIEISFLVLNSGSSDGIRKVYIRGLPLCKRRQRFTTNYSQKIPLNISVKWGTINPSNGKVV